MKENHFGLIETLLELGLLLYLLYLLLFFSYYLDSFDFGLIADCDEGDATHFDCLSPLAF
jgi:hypothetical protein